VRRREARVSCRTCGRDAAIREQPRIGGDIAGDRILPRIGLHVGNSSWGSRSRHVIDLIHDAVNEDEGEKMDVALDDVGLSAQPENDGRY